jgi:DNA uptake protein ComE-like DNA-binding protein
MRRFAAVAALLALILAFSLPVIATEPYHDDRQHHDDNDEEHKTTTTKRDDHTTTTRKHETTTTKKDDSTTTTRKDETTTTKRETTTTKHDDTTTTKPTTTTTKPDGSTTTSSTSSTSTSTSTTTSTTEPPQVTPFCVDVNTAPQAELEQLDGIPPALALLIIANRPYDSVQDLADVLGPGVLALILIANADTGAFASDDCITQTGTIIQICHIDVGADVGVLVEIDLVDWLNNIGHGPGAHGGDFVVDTEGDLLDCLGPDATSTTTSTSTTTTSTTIPAETTTTLPGETTLPPFVFGGAATVCVAEVPTIRIEFQNTFPELAGQTGVLTMADVNGNVVSTQPLVYEPNTTVDLLYPGTSVNPDGSIDDVPGWILTDDGLWIRDPSDEFLREGINLTYTVNPTATAFITYPPESSECANPENPNLPPPSNGIVTPPTSPSPSIGDDGILPLTGDELLKMGQLAGAALLLGLLVLATNHRGRLDTESHQADPSD